jgi:predicted DNA-binding protein YlxM (UPF0122 family)
MAKICPSCNIEKKLELFEKKGARQRLRRRLDHKEEVEKELIARIKTLEQQLKYYDGVYL